MPLRYKDRIIAHLEDHRYEPSNLERLAEDLAIEDGDLPALEAAIDQLISERRAVVDSEGRYRLPPIGREVIGRLKLHPKGFGFVIPETPNREGDLFIPEGETGNATNRDRVRAKVLQARPGRKNLSSHVGRIIEVLERGRTTYVGTLRQQRENWVVIPDHRSFHDNILVRDVRAKNAKDGDKVVVEMIYYPEPGEWAEGVITGRIGEAGTPDVETQSVIISYDLPGEFPDEAIDQARDAASRFRNLESEIERREDLRDRFILTIDPPDARDFDDALSIEKLDDGGWELGVHIADVSHFVDPDSPLDREARARGNSVYLPRHVIPMLPEILSNGVCSLQERVDRLTKSAFIRYDRDARVIDARFSSSVIRSSKRLTYLEAEALLKGERDEARKHATSDSGYPEPLLPALKLMADLADRIRRRRLDDGMIVLTLPEVELVFDDEGRVIDAEPEDDASTHGLIEMFMVEANEAVASLFERMRVPILRRTHPDPSTFDVNELRQYCRVAGVNIPKSPTRFELQRILDLTRGTPRQQAVHLAVLKSLTKAEYSPAMIGHFALASGHYAHFTSPIRRYPDLLVHRALAAYLERTDNGRRRPKGKGNDKLGRTLRGDERVLDEAKLIEIGVHCNDTERNAEMAEQSLRTFLVLQFLEDRHMGDLFEGVVTNVSSNAVFVQIQKYLVEGMIKTRDIPVPGKPKEKGGPAERWTLNPNTGALVATRSGATINVGDRLKVQIVKVDPPARQLDLAVYQERSESTRRREKPPGAAGGKPFASAPKKPGRSNLRKQFKKRSGGAGRGRR